MTAVTSIPSKARSSILRTLQFIEKLRELFPETPPQTVSVFLLIALKPGIYQRDLLNLIDISQAGLSRNVMALSNVNRHGNPGLGLIVQQKDPFDARQVRLHLTGAGRSAVNQVVEHLSLG